MAETTLRYSRPFVILAAIPLPMVTLQVALQHEIAPPVPWYMWTCLLLIWGALPLALARALHTRFLVSTTRLSECHGGRPTRAIDWTDVRGVRWSRLRQAFVVSDHEGSIAVPSVLDEVDQFASATLKNVEAARMDEATIARLRELAPR